MPSSCSAVSPPRRGNRVCSSQSSRLAVSKGRGTPGSQEERRVRSLRQRLPILSGHQSFQKVEIMVWEGDGGPQDGHHAEPRFRLAP